MESRNHQAIMQFEAICDHWSLAPGRMEKLAPYVYIWHPPNITSPFPKALGLSLQAITHGNEVGGIEVLTACLRMLKSGLLQLDFPLGFSLGNPEAAWVDRRFLEKDLNRAFGQQSNQTSEDRRARSLESLLKQTHFFLDIHQTIEPTLSPFFIFPYAPRCMEFASALQRCVPIVTHWGTSFSKDGMCSDEYVNHCGGTGITIELGQKGFHSYYTGVGLHVVLSAIQYVREALRGEFHPPASDQSQDIYTWKAVIAYKEGMKLRDGLVNFQTVYEGQELGQINHKDQSLSEGLLAPAAGLLLFPKYERDPSAPPPKELYRIIKRIDSRQLGLDGVIGV